MPEKGDDYANKQILKDAQVNILSLAVVGRAACAFQRSWSPSSRSRFVDQAKQP